MHKNPGIYVWQLDFLGSIKTDNNNILSFILPNLQFVLLDLIKNPNQEKVVEFFDDLEERCKLFFCDGYVSNQKTNVENINKQLRLFFPKGKTIDTYKKQDIRNINQTLLNRLLRSLDSYTPKTHLLMFLMRFIQ